MTDVAWALAATAHAEAHDTLLDEALVNRVRHLDETPKGSTRWIDSGWALIAGAAAPTP